MHIVMLGDSWGEPNWRTPFAGFTEQGHVSNRLRRWGATVSNYSISGGSNHSTWWSYQTHGENLERPDWIVWFHTDMTRDFHWQHLHGIDRKQPWHYQDILETTARSVYSRCAKIWQDRGSAPLILIEGQSQRMTPLFEEYFRTHWIVKDWRGQLVGQPMPATQMIGPMVGSGAKFFDNCQDSLEQQNLWIDQVDAVMTAMRDSDLFLDNCHPGDRAHEMLFEQLTSFFRSNPI